MKKRAFGPMSVIFFLNLLISGAIFFIFARHTSARLRIALTFVAAHTVSALLALAESAPRALTVAALEAKSAATTSSSPYNSRLVTTVERSLSWREAIL